MIRRRGSKCNCRPTASRPAGEFSALRRSNAQRDCVCLIQSYLGGRVKPQWSFGCVSASTPVRSAVVDSRPMSPILTTRSHRPNMPFLLPRFRQYFSTRDCSPRNDAMPRFIFDVPLPPYVNRFVSTKCLLLRTKCKCLQQPHGLDPAPCSMN